MFHISGKIFRLIGTQLSSEQNLIRQIIKPVVRDLKALCFKYAVCGINLFLPSAVRQRPVYRCLDLRRIRYLILTDIPEISASEIGLHHVSVQNNAGFLLTGLLLINIPAFDFVLYHLIKEQVPVLRNRLIVTNHCQLAVSGKCENLFAQSDWAVGKPSIQLRIIELAVRLLLPPGIQPAVLNRNLSLRACRCRFHFNSRNLFFCSGSVKFLPAPEEYRDGQN